jgi:hypothetical protein
MPGPIGFGLQRGQFFNGINRVISRWFAPTRLK